MKKTIFLSAILMIIFISSCSKQSFIEHNESIKETELFSLFKSKQKAASMHSDILNYAYQKTFSKLRSSDVVEYDVNKEISSTLLSYSAINPDKKIEIINTVGNLNNILFYSDYIKQATEGKLRNNQIEIPSYLTKLFTKLNDIECESEKEFRGKIQEVLMDVYRENSLNEYDLDCLTSVVAVYEDSFLYWIENYDKWVNGETALRKGFWKDVWHAAKHCVTVLGTADAAGAASVYLEATLVATASGGTLAVPASAAVMSAAGASSLFAGAVDIINRHR